MHEFALVQDLMENALAEMRLKKAKRVKSIEVSVGESSGYSSESLKQAYEILIEDTDLKDTKLVLKEVKGRDVLLKRLVMEQ
jgi:Zn finger protein HypA/HybF involved in hydrogenase expression